MIGKPHERGKLPCRRKPTRHHRDLLIRSHPRQAVQQPSRTERIAQIGRSGRTTRKQHRNLLIRPHPRQTVQQPSHTRRDAQEGMSDNPVGGAMVSGCTPRIRETRAAPVWGSP